MRGVGRAAAFRVAITSAIGILWATLAGAQVVSQRGFIDTSGILSPQETVSEPRRAMADALLRQELFLRPAPWFQFAAGLDLRANTHRQVEEDWRVDLEDRGVLRPRAAIRRLSATLSAGGFTLDVGKQFIRWGRADVVYPTDRFAPRDYLNVLQPELLPVIGVRPSLQVANETVEAVWVPQLTPSRLPLLDQRWAIVASVAESMSVVDGGSRVPRGPQYGVRWRHTGERIELAAMFFDGYNHLPDIDAVVRAEPQRVELTRLYPAIRMYGADAAVPTGWFTVKLESAYVTSTTDSSDEYVLYVIELERQVGEWLLDAGYVGELERTSRQPLSFSPDRGVARSIIGRATYTVDPQRTVILEGAARQGGEGFYAKAEYSQALGQNWRVTVTGAGIRGDPGDFLGQYRRNSHASAALRFSF